jgi:sugar phosphate isomerase/epimerase
VKEVKMKFGAGVWPFQWDPPFEDTIRRIAGLGFRAVELVAWDQVMLDEYYTPQRIKDLRRLLADEGLELSEFVSTPSGMASAEPAAREQAIEHFKRLVEVGVALGTKLVNTVAPTPFELRFPPMALRHLRQECTLDFDPARDWRQNWADYVEVMHRFCEICEDAGVRYAIEPHPDCWVHNAAGMMRVLDLASSPALGMNFDPSHLFPMGEIPQIVIYEVGERVFHTHFSDNDGTTNAHWRPGKGKIDWSGVLRALQDVGYDHVISLELEDVPGVARSSRRGDLPPLQSSTEALDREYLLAKAYLSSLCQELGISIEE